MADFIPPEDNEFGEFEAEDDTPIQGWDTPLYYDDDDFEPCDCETCRRARESYTAAVDWELDVPF